MWKMEYSVKGCVRISVKYYDSFEDAVAAKRRWESSNSTGHYWATLEKMTNSDGNPYTLFAEEYAKEMDKRRNAISQEEFSVMVAEQARTVADEDSGYDNKPWVTARTTAATTTCAWFALCMNDADGTLPHPVLGDVPCCTRCADKVGETLQ